MKVSFKRVSVVRFYINVVKQIVDVGWIVLGKGTY